MAELSLPQNSKIKKGKNWNEPDKSKGEWKEFRVYR
jgi:succinate dehydrogenase / fumarate reductase iron-sulfur subunit